jgi:hypothetical protein
MSRFTPSPTKATVTSSSPFTIRLLTTIPSPKRRCFTRSPARQAGSSSAPSASPAPGAEKVPLPEVDARSLVGCRRHPLANGVELPSDRARRGQVGQRDRAQRLPDAARRRSVAARQPAALVIGPGPALAAAPERRGRALRREEVLRQLGQEAGRIGLGAHAVGGPMMRMDEVQPILGARHAHVGQASLLLELTLVLERTAMGQQPLLQPDDEDDRELEPLGRVEGDERDAVRHVLQLVLVADERHLLEEAGEPLGRGDLVELGGVAAQLEHVRPALLALVGAVVDGRLQARPLERGVEDRRWRLGGTMAISPA